MFERIFHVVFSSMENAFDDRMDIILVLISLEYFIGSAGAGGDPSRLPLLVSLADKCYLPDGTAAIYCRVVCNPFTGIECNNRYANYFQGWHCAGKLIKLNNLAVMRVLFSVDEIFGELKCARRHSKHLNDIRNNNGPFNFGMAFVT